MRLTAGSAAILCRLLGRDPVRDSYGWIPSKQCLQEFGKLALFQGALEVQVEDGFEGGLESTMIDGMGELPVDVGVDDGGVQLVVLPVKNERSYDEWWDDWKRAADATRV